MKLTGIFVPKYFMRHAKFFQSNANRRIFHNFIPPLLLRLLFVITQLNDRALWAIGFARAADLTPQADEVQMRGVIGFRWKEGFQMRVRLLHGHFFGAQASPPADAVDVCIHWKGGHVERKA